MIDNSPNNSPTLSIAALALLLTVFGMPWPAAADGLAHEMAVEVFPESGEIMVQDHIRFDANRSQIDFTLNAGLRLSTPAEARIVSRERSADGLRARYRVELEQASEELTLHYRGRPVFSERRTLGDMPEGLVSAQSIYLDAGSAWYPQFGSRIDRLDLHVRLPEGWRSVSIGRYRQHEGADRWTTDVPHDDLYLIAGRYTRHARRHGDIDLSVWLLNDDRELAERYLGLMGGYIDHYSELIGNYPFAKFAVVENRWQTGFGMPSFTLLGSRVLRLPFIPYTSLPHEILHNWFGNGVWVDYAKGNWSEGLTAYLADHWMAERRGKGATHRLKALQRYSNFAADRQDLPLARFVSRHNDASQSVGYSKSLMVFHMLRLALGDAAFTTGLQRLWQTQRFRRIGFAQAIQAIAGPRKDIARRFQLGLARPGAPRLELGEVDVQPNERDYRLAVALKLNERPPAAIAVPIYITFEPDKPAQRTVVQLEQKTNPFSFDLDRRPLRIDIDPEYDLLRILDASEQPPALNRLFGAETVLVLPSAADPAMLRAWRALGERWQRRYPGLSLSSDSEERARDTASNRIICGWDNRQLMTAAKQLERTGQALGPRTAIINGKAHSASAHSIVLVNTEPNGVSTGFLGAPTVAAVEALARKLPHYGSYSQLLFDASSGKNTWHHSLPATQSRLSRQLTDSFTPLRLPTRPALAVGSPFH